MADREKVTKIFQIGMDEVLKMEQEGSDNIYEKFKDKFKPKKTTDDCYTPEIIYDAVAGWVSKEYKVDKAAFVRPFWPGEDYKEADYSADCVVVDNPPFSIIAEITRWYCEKKIRFFLFSPALTLFSVRNVDVSYLAAGCPITYENGAEVVTSFITNLDTCRARTCPELYRLVKLANEENLKEGKKVLPKYEYPDEVITAAIVQRWTHYGVEWKLDKDACVKVSALDKQKEKGKAIFGSGFLLSERAAAERAAEERAAAHKWELSDREKQIISTLK